MVELGEARAAELTVEAVVEPRFLDAMGHMNVAWYVYLFDRGIWEFFERHGLDERYRQRESRGMFALEESLRYLSELREGQALHVHTAALEVRPKTLRLQQYMVDCEAQKVAAVREVVAAHIDLSTRRSAPFGEAVLAQLHAAPHVEPTGTLSEAAAQRFARDWVAAWNRRDAEAVLSHYAEDAVFISPKAERFVGKPRIEGKAALRAYWQTAVSQISSIEFVLDHALWSPRAETLTVVYQASFDRQTPVRVAEIMRFRGHVVVQGEALYGAQVLA
jgi:acyl-CoA thioester hydrolase